jgi:hypothetical protein
MSAAGNVCMWGGRWWAQNSLPCEGVIDVCLHCDPVGMRVTSEHSDQHTQIRYLS